MGLDIRWYRSRMDLDKETEQDTEEAWESYCLGSFRAGSYGGYGEWREEISLAFLGVMPHKVWENPENYEGQPFVGLIDFSDCDGVIEGDRLKKLAQDFSSQENRLRFDSFLHSKCGISSDRVWSLEKYDLWKAALTEAARTDGVVLLC